MKEIFMPSTEQLRGRLLRKLAELFQLNQPDLDFGFYRIMHAKAREVQSFIDTDLLKIVSDAFGEVDEAKRLELQAEYEKALQTARDFGAPNPEETEPVKKAKASLDALKESAGNEAEIYDHLYRFFERYYDDGDFISRRYFTRETSGKAAPFAIPYNGEEVKLHWANADQYYVKSAEYFSNYSFDLLRSAEVRAMSGEERTLNNIPESPHMVHFKVVDASEGEHGNVKESDATKRFFIIHKDTPVEFNDAGELVINFEYRNDPEKSGNEGTWRDKRIAEAVETVLSAEIEHPGWRSYKQLLTVPAPTEKDKTRPVLAKYINQYTARNTMDYFIHKDLRTFLKRELDFYIKNEVMQLDDIESADVPSVETYLSKIKVLRRIAGQLIGFLAQLEEFQKKLWLKKKFVIETNYCITLDRIPEEMYPEIASNHEQIEEWIELGFVQNHECTPIDTNKDTPDLFSQNIGVDSCSLVVQNIKSNDKLVLDTRFFDEAFKAKLISAIEDFDEQCDGLLIHSENFQALTLLHDKYREQVKCIYIDPPYNTGSDDNFSYKDSYQSSSWLSMFQDRLWRSYPLFSAEGLLACHMDEHEHLSLEWLVRQLFGKSGDLGKLIWDKRNPKGDAKGIAAQHEYVHFATPNPSHLKSIENAFSRNKENAEAILDKAQQLIQKAGCLNETVRKQFREWISKQDFTGGEKAYSLIDENDDVYRPVSMAWPNKKKAPDEYFVPLIHPATKKPCPVPMRGWRNPPETMAYLLKRNQILFGEDETTIPNRKYLLKENLTENVASLYYMGSSDDALFNDMGFSFENPKPIKAAKYFLSITARPIDATILDYFAGSGTTGHAVINLNREDGGKRKYILVEMGNYFDTVLKPRIIKVVYSDSWKDGKPTERDTGISHCFKYLRLESYEDTLNNLRFQEDTGRAKALEANPDLKQDYTLNYMLDVETRGSQSLLNIDAFTDPTSYTLEVKKPGSDEYTVLNVDLLETFNYLIGLRVVHYGAPQEFTAKFKRMEDPEVPTDQKTKLVLDGTLQQIKVNHKSTQIDTNKKDSCSSVSISGSKTWWFRKVEGWAPKDPADPNNGQREKVLIVWRKLTGNLEEDNLMLDEWFQKNRISTRDFEFDTIYVNGSNNLPNLKLDGDTWKVRLTEEEFMKRMWDVEQ
jgi:adenine-specific DNA-methyltransferase